MKLYNSAKDHFQNAINMESDFSEFSEYFKAAAIVNENQDNYGDAINCMNRARYKLMARMNDISNYPCVMKEIKSLQQKSGQGLSSDLYAKQIEGRMEIYNAFKGSIAAAIGAESVDLQKNLVSAHCTDDQAKKFQEALLKYEPLFRTSYALIPEFNFTESTILEKLKICEYTPKVKSNISSKLLETYCCLGVQLRDVTLRSF